MSDLLVLSYTVFVRPPLTTILEVKLEVRIVRLPVGSRPYRWRMAGTLTATGTQTGTPAGTRSIGPLAWTLTDVVSEQTYNIGTVTPVQIAANPSASGLYPSVCIIVPASDWGLGALIQKPVDGSGSGVQISSTAPTIIGLGPTTSTPCSLIASGSGGHVTVLFA